MDVEDIAQNERKITQQLQIVLSKLCNVNAATNDGVNERIKIVNNRKWYENMESLKFFRNIGKHFKMQDMLSRERYPLILHTSDSYDSYQFVVVTCSVKSRLVGRNGMSFAEFSYQIFQGYDFYHLRKNHDCILQIGGSDQYGNIISGIEYIDRVSPDLDAYGLTMPLLTTKTGEKFGKSAGNAVWLDASDTDPLQFFQVSVLMLYIYIYTVKY